MATTEELIRQAQILPLSAESDEKCAIDPETREITVPERYRLLGVESDEKVERIEFRCPKVVGDNINLSQLQIRVNYQNANGEKDQYIVTDLESDIENITFSWLLSRKVTAYKGEVRFIICAVKISGESITNEWNTTIATAEVLEGMEVDTPSPTEQESDVIAQLLQIMKDTSDQAVEAVESAEATAKQAIEDYTEQMKATIPEDYTEMVKKVDILERTKAPAILQTVSGNPITLADAGEGTPVVDFAMDGKTEQVQTTGAQLFDASKLKTKTQGNVTITNNGDGSFTVTGSGNVPGTEYPSIMLSKEESLKLIKPGTLRLAENSDVRPRFMAGLRNTQTNTFRKTVGNQLQLSIEITEDDIQKIESGQDVFSYCFFDNADVQIVPGTIKPMVYIGDNPQIPWEPYTGRQPSPSPDYPQKIEISGSEVNVEVNVTGAQLFDASKLKTKTQGNVTITNNGDGSFTVTGSGNVPGTEYPSIMLSKEESLKLIKPGTLRLAENSDVRPRFMAGLRNTQTNTFRKTVGNQLQLSIEITEDDIQKIESGQDVFSYCFFDNADVQIVPGTIKPMVYIGDNPQIPWEPYRTPQTLTLQSNRPLTKWDRMEKRDGQWGWVFNSNNIVFDGSEDENWMKHSNNRFYIAISDKIGSDLNGEKNYLCNKLIPFNTNIAVINMPNNTIKESGIPGQKNMYLRIDEAGNDVESFKTWLQSNSLLIWYKTAEETFVPLTTPEQSALEALTTYFPTTIITVEDGELAPEIKIEYVADTKTYIDNKFAELAQNLSATQNTLLEV